MSRSTQTLLWKKLERYLKLALSEDYSDARTGTQLLFENIFEPLGDSFLVENRKLQKMMMARTVSRVRLLPQAKKFHKRMCLMGLNNEDDLCNRAQALTRREPPLFPVQVQRVLVPSRVTLGADILLTSTIIQTCLQAFPNAEIVFLGTRKNGALLAEESTRFRIRTQVYPRRGLLLARILTWLDLVDIIREETRGLTAGRDFIVIDPDSRLLQSGLLPLLPIQLERNSYFYWEPAGSQDSIRRRSQLSDLIGWLRKLFEFHTHDPIRGPSVYLEQPIVTWSKEVLGRLGLTNKRFLVGINLGVGENQGKRIQKNRETLSDFEQQLVLGLLELGATLVLDAGMGDEELAQAQEILLQVQSSHFETVHVIGQNIHGNVPRDSAIRLVLFQGSVRRFGALLQHCQLYLGYDSLGQHLAGALGLDLITVFGGHASNLFARRWKPGGKGKIHIIESGPGPFDTQCQTNLANKILTQVRSLVQES